MFRGPVVAIKGICTRGTKVIPLLNIMKGGWLKMFYATQPWT